MSDVTKWLRRLDGGDDQALDELLPLLYDELRTMAERRRASERQHHTLTSTALVHETYLRMLKQRRLQAQDRTEFLAIAAVTMRRVLVDYARQRNRDKRGGGVQPLPLDGLPLSGESALLSKEETMEVLNLNEALERLHERSARAANVVQLRFFGGLSVSEIADHLNVTVRTVHRDWIAARAWLRKEVADAAGLESARKAIDSDAMAPL